ncbi:hypothetical protein [Streptomyces sp. NBC_00425]|uniref:hypothetical protein n=1 Tax=Streptomyces sp. NBC_00425 TaxID=2975740 RepID=UPI002E1FE59D
MDSNLTPEQAAAAALAHLLAEHPQLGSITWSVGERPGVLTGRLVAETGHGEIIDDCAEVMGGTVARTSHYRDDDGHGVAQLVTSYRDVPVHVWATYLLPDSTGLTSTDLRQLLAGRPLGTLPMLPGGAL